MQEVVVKLQELSGQYHAGKLSFEQLAALVSMTVKGQNMIDVCQALTGHRTSSMRRAEDRIYHKLMQIR